MKELLDYFGQKVEVGDIVLGATPKRNHFQDTNYSISVVISRTKGMLRLHKLGDSSNLAHMSKNQILDHVKQRGGRKGGRVLAEAVINLKKPTGITEQEFTQVNVPPISTAPSLFTTVFP